MNLKHLESTLLGSSPIVTPILGCNMAILVAIRINCIYVWSLTSGYIWNGAIAFCILLMWCCNMMVLQCTKKLTQPRYGCKHGYCYQQNGCVSYCCNKTRGCHMTLLPRMNLSQNNFIATPQLCGNMAILPCSVLHCIIEILQHNKFGGQSHNCHVHLLVVIDGKCNESLLGAIDGKYNKSLSVVIDRKCNKALLVVIDRKYNDSLLVVIDGECNESLLVVIDEKCNVSLLVVDTSYSNR